VANGNMGPTMSANYYANYSYTQCVWCTQINFEVQPGQTMKAQAYASRAIAGDVAWVLTVKNSENPHEFYLLNCPLPPESPGQYKIEANVIGDFSATYPGNPAAVEVTATQAPGPNGLLSIVIEKV
jgi:hypothetical protein